MAKQQKITTIRQITKSKKNNIFQSSSQSYFEDGGGCPGADVQVGGRGAGVPISIISIDLLTTSKPVLPWRAGRLARNLSHTFQAMHCPTAFSLTTTSCSERACWGHRVGRVCGRGRSDHDKYPEFHKNNDQLLNI